MKKLLLVAVLIAPLATASDYDKKAESHCQTMKKIGRIVMELRQRGAHLEDVVDSLDFHSHLAISAYEEPVHPRSKEKEKAIEDFAHHAYVGCVRKHMYRRDVP